MHNPGMIYGYARVSTAAQDETGQVRQLKAAGCEKVFREKITGTTADRPQLAALMKKLAPGDVVITPAVDRLSRDTTDLLIIARDMQRAGAGIRSLAEPFPRYDPNGSSWASVASLGSLMRSSSGYRVGSPPARPVQTTLDGMLREERGVAGVHIRPPFFRLQWHGHLVEPTIQASYWFPERGALIWRAPAAEWTPAEPAAVSFLVLASTL
jgi:hypothetical protein